MSRRATASVFSCLRSGPRAELGEEDDGPG